MGYVNLTSEITFREALQRLGESYQSVDASALVKKDGDGCRNIIMVIRLVNDTVDQVSRRHEDFSKRFGSLLGADGGVLFHATDYAEWPAFEKRFCEGYVDFGNQPVETRVKADDFISILCRNSSDTIESTHSDKFPRISCQIQFDSRKELFLGESMFTGVALNMKELSKSCLGFEGEKSYGVLLELPIYSRISEKDFSNPEKPIIRLVSHPSLEPGVGCAVVQKSNPREYGERVRKSTYFESSEINWRQDENWAYAEVPYTVDKHEFMRRDVVVARLVMDFGMVQSDETYLRQHLPLPSPGELPLPDILSALGVCDGWKRIEEMLGLTERRHPFSRNQTDAFLLGISWLLEVIGLDVFQLENRQARFSLGIIRLEEEHDDKLEIGDIDILASDEGGNKVYAIDCTLNPPDSKKADLISNCADVVEKKARIRCDPIIMVATSAPNSKETIKTALVLDKDDISAMLDLVMQGDTRGAMRLFESETLNAGW